MTLPKLFIKLSFYRHSYLFHSTPNHISHIKSSIRFSPTIKYHEFSLFNKSTLPMIKSTRALRGSGCPYRVSSESIGAPSPIPLVQESSTKKDMMDLPGPIGWPIVGNFLSYLRPKNIGKMHLIQEKLHNKYGKIFKEKWGPNWQVHVSDPKLMEEIYRQEGRYPNRPALRSWILYREINKMPHGLTTAQGKEWQLYRTEFGKKLFSPQEVDTLITPINQVSDELVEKMKSECDRDASLIADSLPNLAYMWSFEAAGSFLFETRLGCLSKTIPPRTKSFLDSLFKMMSSSLFIIVGESFHQKHNTFFWKQHAQAWDNIFKIGKEIIGKKLEPTSSKDPPLFLSHFINNPNLTKEQIYTNITELLMAASDTTANTLCFALYLLAQNPEKQEKLRNEIEEVIEPSSSIQIQTEHLPQLKYLRSVIKETMRMFPVVTMNCRILDSDIVLDGYNIPKNTLLLMNQYTSSMDSDYFPEPQSFMPERWLRNQSNTFEDDEQILNDLNKNKKHPFACIPFGFGSRSCLGKHVANMELAISIAKIVHTFNLEEIKGEKIKTKLRTLLNPGKRIPIKIKARK